MGCRRLKGVADSVDLHAMLPADLAPRFELSQEEAAETSNMQRAQTMRNLAAIRSKAVLGRADATPGMGKRLGLKLRRTHATTAFLSYQFPHDPTCGGSGQMEPSVVLDEMCALLRVAVEAAEQAEGLFEAAHGDKMAFGWNMTRACATHVQQAIRFAALLHSRQQPIVADDMGFAAGFGITASSFSDSIGRRPEEEKLPHCIGIASGRALSGTVGTARQRFRTVFGRSVRVAAACADACALFDTGALLSRGMNAGSTGGIGTFLRPVDVWRDPDGGILPVEEIDLLGIANAEAAFGVWDFLAESECAGMGGGEVVAAQSSTSPKKVRGSKDQASLAEYKRLFSAAVAGSADALQLLRRMAEKKVRQDGGCKDSTLVRVVNMLEQHQLSTPQGRNYRCDLPTLQRAASSNTGPNTYKKQLSQGGPRLDTGAHLHLAGVPTLHTPEDSHEISTNSRTDEVEVLEYKSMSI